MKPYDLIVRLLKLLAIYGFSYEPPIGREGNEEYQLKRRFPEHWWLTCQLWTTIDAHGLRPRGADAMRLILIGNGTQEGIIWSFKDIRRTRNKLHVRGRLTRRVGVAVELAETAPDCLWHNGPWNLYVLDSNGELCWVCTAKGCSSRSEVDPRLAEQVRKETPLKFWDMKRLPC